MKLPFAAVAHALAACAVVSTALALTFVGYFALLAIAVVTNGDIGGVLALPFMMVLTLLGSSLAVLAVLFPVLAATSFLCSVLFRWPRFLETVVAVLLLVLQVSVLLALDVALDGISVRAALVALPIVVVLLLPPLTIYWWVLQSVDLVRRCASALWARRPFVDRPRRRATASLRPS